MGYAGDLAHLHVREACTAKAREACALSLSGLRVLEDLRTFIAGGTKLLSPDRKVWERIRKRRAQRDGTEQSLFRKVPPAAGTAYPPTFPVALRLPLPGITLIQTFFEVGSSVNVRPNSGGQSVYLLEQFLG